MKSSKRNLLTALLLMFAHLIYGQTQVTDGIVTDSSGEPLIGASVQLKGSTLGTITDFEGRFSLQIPSDGKTVVISYIGFITQEAPVGKSLRIRLAEDSKSLDDIVIVGYSSQKRSTLTGSVVTINSDKLNDVTAPDVASLLQGKIAGVQVNTSTGAPGSTPEILIRGAGSITAQASPLYVVDGISGGTYNPNDVETITVLKDAAATSLYGSAAAGGVIIVTTKRGQMQQPLSVSVKGTFGNKWINNGNFRLMSGEQLYDFHKQAMLPEVFEVQRPTSLKRQNFDWIDAAFGTGFIQNYNVSVSGGSDRVAYRLSADYYDEAGTLINTDYKRTNIRANVSFMLHKNVRLNTNVSFTNSTNQNYAWYTLDDAYKNMPWDNPYDSNGQAVFINSNKRPDNGKTWYGNRKMNFIQSEEYNSDTYAGNGIVADATLIWQITDKFSFESRNRGSFGNGKSVSFRDPRTFDTSWASRGMIYESMSSSASIGNTNLIKYRQDFTGGHVIDAFVGAEFGYWKNQSLAARGLDLPAVGLASVSIAANKQDITSPLTEGAGMSFLGQVQYGYNEKYLASVSFRTDASSTFGPQNRWGMFPAGSLAWVVSEEDFLQKNDLLSYLKIRGSYGLTGNSSIGQYRYLSNYDLNALYNGQIGAVSSQLGNPALGWESAHMANLGVDVEFIRRITLSVDLYNTDNKDLLLNVPIAPSEGHEVRLKNAGSVRNQGIEIQISSVNIDGKFRWTTDFNISSNRNSVLSIPNGEAFTTSVSGSTTLNQIIEEGTDIFTWYLPKWAGVNANDGTPQWWKTKDKDGNDIAPVLTGDYAEANNQNVGSANAKFTGGINNTFSYWGFSLGINCNFVYGNLIYNRGRESFDRDGATLDMNQMVLHKGWSRWAKPGDMATHPKPIAGGNNNADKTSSRYLEDGSYFRIRNITLAYNFTPNVVAKLKCKAIRLYVSADNPFTYTNYSGMDPEVSFQRAEYTLPGMQSFKYPVSRQLLGGIEITF